MALSSSFQERLQCMEATRNHRLSLLQAEKDLHSRKYLQLASKLSDLRSGERRCLRLEQKIASQTYEISSLKSEILSLDADYQNYNQQLGVLKREVEELEESEKEQDRYYGSKSSEMEEFQAKVEKFTVNRRAQVQELRDRLDECKSKLQGNKGNWSNPAIAAAEKRKSELLALKENLDRTLASNYQVRAQLQKQLHSLLVMQRQERTNTTLENNGKELVFDQNGI